MFPPCSPSTRPTLAPAPASSTKSTQLVTMKLSNRTQCSSCSSSRPSSRPRLPLRVTATAIPTNGYVPPSPSSLDRPAGGGSRSYDLPPASDLVAWAPRSDFSRPSNGANRGPSFATASSSSDATGSIDRPGGRGGRGDMPSSNDSPVGGDPALLLLRGLHTRRSLQRSSPLPKRRAAAAAARAKGRRPSRQARERRSEGVKSEQG